jgi:endopeptidase La
MTDIDNFIKFLNTDSNKTKKRKNAELMDEEEIVQGLYNSAFSILWDLSQQLPKNIKGDELSELLGTLKKEYQYQMNANKKNKVIIEEEPEVVRLLLIAISSICVKLLTKINKYVLKNKTKTFLQCINAVSKEMGYNINDKKPKIIFETTQLDEEVEEEDDYGDNDDDDGSDDSEEEEEERPIITTLTRRDEKEFLELVYKNDTNDIDEVLLKYYSKLPVRERANVMNNIKDIKNFQSNVKPMLFQIMELPLPMNQKNHVLKAYNTLTNSRHNDNKLRNWFESLMTIPFGKYKGINLDSIETTKVKNFIDNLQSTMDSAVYGHDEAKRHIIQLMGQQIRNPKSKGNILGIYGVPGNGKTTIIKEGIAKAMDKPFVFISLGGATDSSFLEGHSYTYEGSVYGRIVNGLISSKCMDPIIYFDELDKISKTPKGEEITNILVHLTDPVQNCHFRDKYFHGIDIDLSRATIIFSFNDPDNVNPILMDRITTVETKYLLAPQKIHIANNYLLKEIMKEMGLKEKDVVLSEKVLEKIISGYTREGGVRKLKSLLYNIVRELNIANLLKAHIGSNVENRVKFPFVVKEEHLKSLLKDKYEIEPEKIHTEDKVGVMNGLWANSYGNGGILEIQSLWIPTTVPYEVRATGNLQQVIKESTQVASSLAFNVLTKKQQTKYLSEWKTRPQGIHLHFPDGATPKDGPSAGGALAVTIYSLLANKKIRHDVAMTGEINFQGKITAIGGLENKLEGAKRAGVKLALYPKENQKDMDKIYERNPTLVDGTFKVLAIETLEQAIQQTIVE